MTLRACASPSIRAANSRGACAIRSTIREGITWLWMSILIGCTLRKMGRSAPARREVDLDAAAGHEQVADLQCRARWRRREEFLPDLVEIEEVAKIRQEYLRL